MSVAPVGQRDSYLHLWREFVFHSHLNPVNRRVAFTKQCPPYSDAMNVATVHPVHENGFPDSISDHEPEDLHALMSRTKDILGVDEVVKVDFLVSLFSEALGTFFLVLIGCASCVTWESSPPPTVVHIAFTFGLAVAALAQVLGPISGCHVNPAVTIGLVASGNCSILRGFSYVICQCCGAIGGSGALKVAIPKSAAASGIGLTKLNLEISVVQGIIVEALVTFLLVLVVHAVTDAKRTDTRGWAPLAIGLTITVSHLAAVPATGSSMNPARSLGPAVILGEWKDHWVYWVGPFLGGVFAGGLYRMGFRQKSKDDDEASYDF